MSTLWILTACNVINYYDIAVNNYLQSLVLVMFSFMKLLYVTVYSVAIVDSTGSPICLLLIVPSQKMWSWLASSMQIVARFPGPLWTAWANFHGQTPTHTIHHKAPNAYYSTGIGKKAKNVNWTIDHDSYMHVYSLKVSTNQNTSLIVTFVSAINKQGIGLV